ncbi:fumarylacetoacetase [Paracoccus aerodenitrificans]|uniref:fumarylacetoacetase n=1 Tax=Paracoccus aerodenitrificans TaxID=3017781 RepID=UPI0022F0DC45|nr:fumarylacetoacetase [Paracoccus aerodenitrificans]WBU63742.1 fumarylacetoacetase [Paracoccus aerodenitrificans]
MSQKTESWVESANTPDCEFPIQNLPYGVFSVNGDAPRCGVAIGDLVVDLAACERAGLLDAGGTFSAGQLNDFIALGSEKWAELREALTGLLAVGGNTDLPTHPMQDVTMHLPIRVTEYTDFYASRNHAFNVGVLFRGPENALPAQWTHMPIGYNGRASSVIVSGTDVIRPKGQLRTDGGPVWGPCKRLDLELEIGAIVGAETRLGESVDVETADRMIFGYVLLNDWSARDIQAWEYQPLGPFQSKAFATTISPWIVTSAALEPFRSEGAARDNELLPYLQEKKPGLYDINLSWSLNDHVLSRTNYNVMYYSSAQQLAHHTSSGCPMRVGDLLGSGTISGPTRESTGALLEMTEGGKNPVDLGPETRSFIQDGDTITLAGYAQADGYRIGFGPCTGTVKPARD